MSVFFERLMELIAKSGKTSKEIEQDLKLSRNTVYDWKNGKNKSYRKYAQELAQYFNVSPCYLIGSQDIKKEAHAEMQELSEIEMFIINAFRAMNEADKSHIVWTVERAIASQPIDEQASNRQLIALEVQRQYAEQMRLQKEHLEDGQG